MEKDSGLRSLYQHSEKQSPNLNFSIDPLKAGQQSFLPTSMKPYTNEVSINGNFPTFAFSGLPQSKGFQQNEPGNWFYCLPRFRQAFVPPVNTVPKEKFPLQEENFERISNLNTGTGFAQKRFLVFDQFGDQTLVYSSGLRAPVHCPPSFNPMPPATYSLIREDSGTKKDFISHFSPFMSNEHDEENQDDLDSEMHEDTEELDALLDSDYENDHSDDDEVTSTGHSPSTMTDHGIAEHFDERDEEVASCCGPNKRRKLLAGDCNVPSPMNPASSMKPNNFSEFEDDAQSSSGNLDDHASEESNFVSCTKRSRKEKIRETLNILQSIIPGGKGKDTIVVIDEAIHHLKCLKVKAKSLGLDAL